jgi:hypothetical protein
MKTNDGGNLQGSKTYGGLQDDFIPGMEPTYNGGYILCGSTESFGQENNFSN